MPKQKQLTEARKKWIRENFDSIDPLTPTKPELSYYNKIKAGRARAKKAIRIEGKYLGGKIVDTIARVAAAKGKSVQRYIDENKNAILNLINVGSTHVSKDIDKTIEIVGDMKRKTVEVQSGNGIIIMDKHEAIEQLASFQQHVKSTTKVVMLATTVRTFTNNKIQITIPEGYDQFEGDELIDFLDEFPDLYYIES